MRLPRIDLGRLRDLAASRGISLHLSGRRRTIARWAGMALLAIVSFLVTLKYTFPYERLKGKLIDALSDKYDVTVGDVGSGFMPGTVVFEHVLLRSRPAGPDEKPSEIVLDELAVDLGLDFGLLGALRKRAVFDIDAELGAGEIEADVVVSSSLFEAHIRTQSLALANLPGVAAAVGLPMSGDLDADVELRLPGGKWKNAEGRIHLDCDGCTVGDGVTKMSMTPSATSSNSRRRRTTAAAAAWGAQGVTVPRLSLGQTSVVVDISKGVGDIKTFSAESKDGWLKIEGKIEFRDPFGNSAFPGCMRFKLSDELKKRAPDFGNVEYTLSEKVRQADGSFAIPTKGKLTELRWDVRRKCGGGSTEDEGDGRSQDRPGLAGRPSLDTPVPPQGGLPVPVPVEPSQVPGVSGEAGEPGTAASSATAEIPPPGTSGPPVGAEGAPPVSTGPFDAGAGATVPPQPADDEAPGEVRTMRRFAPQVERPIEGSDYQPPSPPTWSPPVEDDGGARSPESDQPALQAAPRAPVEREVQGVRDPTRPHVD